MIGSRITINTEADRPQCSLESNIRWDGDTGVPALPDRDYGVPGHEPWSNEELPLHAAQELSEESFTGLFQRHFASGISGDNTDSIQVIVDVATYKARRHTVRILPEIQLRAQSRRSAAVVRYQTDGTNNGRRRDLVFLTKGKDVSEDGHDPSTDGGT